MALEAVDNAARHGKDGPVFYQRLLTNCWIEAYRLLRPGGILTFTFHHDKDDPWVAVLESLFDAGFYLEAAFPVRADETKGEGSTPGTFGAQKVEYDIIHVCRKRTEERAEIPEQFLLSSSGEWITGKRRRGNHGHHQCDGNSNFLSLRIKP